MAVYYKFKSAKDYDSIPIEGQFISVVNLKQRIFETKLFGKGTDFDLMISNAQTSEEYLDEGALICKNTSVLVRRIPGWPQKPIVIEREKPKVEEEKEDLPPSSSMLVGDSFTTNYPEEFELEEFGDDSYAIPEVNPPQRNNPVLDVSLANKVDEDNKIKALVDTSALDWNRQTQDAYGGGGRGLGSGIGGKSMSRRGFGRGMLEHKTPPPGYVCHRCKVSGHFIQHCPTNGDPNYDIKRVKPPTGIPKSMLMATPDGSYALPSGAVAILKPNEAAFEKEIEGLPTTHPVNDLPPELHCPLCKEVMKDAALTSKCCFKSFCDKCIRDYIIINLMCVCGASNVLADDLIPNRTLREAICRILELATSSSTENAGSLVQVQDMESARPLQPKLPSATLSAASKDKSEPPTEVESTNKEGEIASEIKTANTELSSIDKQTAANASEVSLKWPKSPETAPVLPEDVQKKQFPGGKKKKKKDRLSGTAADMQWKGYQDHGAEHIGMPLAASSYNLCWASGMPTGVDAAYMSHFFGPMPFMGYASAPFDVSFGGIFPQDPFAAQAYLIPPVPRDVSEFGKHMSTMGMSQELPPGIGREAWKADMTQNIKMERLNERERERSKHRGRDRRRESSSTNDASSMKSRPRPTPYTDRVNCARSENLQREDRDRLDSNSTRHSPPHPRKRRATDQDELLSSDASAERKQMTSIFSRIGFPDQSKGAASKKRKSSSFEIPLPKSGLKEELATRKAGSEGYQNVVTGARSSSRSARKGNSGLDQDSSEDAYHFKQRLRKTWSRREAAEDTRDAAALPPKRSRDHEPL